MPLKKRRRFVAIPFKEDEKMNPKEDERKEKKMTSQPQLTTTFCSNFDKTSDVHGFLLLPPSENKTKLVLNKEDEGKEMGDVAINTRVRINGDQMTMIKWGITRRRSKVNGDSTNSNGTKEERKYYIEGSSKDDDLYTKVKKGRMLIAMKSETEVPSGRECTRFRFHGKDYSFRVLTHDCHSLDETNHPREVVIHERKKSAIKRKMRKTRSIHELLQDKSTIPSPPAEMIQESSLLVPNSLTTDRSTVSLLISPKEK